MRSVLADQPATTPSHCAAMAAQCVANIRATLVKLWLSVSTSPCIATCAGLHRLSLQHCSYNARATLRWRSNFVPGAAPLRQQCCAEARIWRGGGHWQALIDGRGLKCSMPRPSLAELLGAMRDGGAQPREQQKPKRENARRHAPRHASGSLPAALRHISLRPTVCTNRTH